MTHEATDGRHTQDVPVISIEHLALHLRLSRTLVGPAALVDDDGGPVRDILAKYRKIVIILLSSQYPHPKYPKLAKTGRDLRRCKDRCGLSQSTSSRSRIDGKKLDQKQLDR